MAVSYRTAIIREVTNALKKTFDSSYADPLLRDISVGPDYQFAKESFPRIGVTYNETLLQSMGIGHTTVANSGNNEVSFKHWMFQGTLLFTLMALSSLDRDTLADNLLDVVAFGTTDSHNGVFHREITDSELIALILMKDKAIPGSNTAVPTPWQAEDELLYESSYSFNVYGEFYSDPYTATIVQLSHVALFPYRPDQAIPGGSADPAPWPN